MLRKPGSRAAIGVCFAFVAHAQAPPPQPVPVPVPTQARPAVPKAAPPQPKPIDIGAREAPLSDQERADLDRSVTKHNYAAEKAIIDQAMIEHPDSFELLVMAGRLGYLERNPKDSADALVRADKIKPLGDTDRMTLALALSFSDRLSQARIELLKLIKTDARNAEYYFLLGRIDANGSHPEDAAKEYAKAVELDPTMVRAYENLGQVQENLNLPDEARKTYEQGVLRNRANKVHWEWSPLDLAVFQLKANDLDAADKLLREALQYNPRFGWAHYHMGQLFQKQGKEAEAMTEYKEAVIDDPRLRQAWLALGRQFTRQGNKVQADRALEIFKQLEAQDNARQGKKN
jgi:tetratricopeptide (TPR) repeat protein